MLLKFGLAKPSQSGALARRPQRYQATKGARVCVSPAPAPLYARPCGQLRKLRAHTRHGGAAGTPAPLHLFEPALIDILLLLSDQPVLVLLAGAGRSRRVSLRRLTGAPVCLWPGCGLASGD